MKKILILIFGTLFFPLVAFAIPGIPHQFYGQVDFSNGPAPDGVGVEAKITGVTVAITTTLNGKYGYSPLFFITDPDNNRTGKEIKFFVGGIEGGSAIFVNGEHTEIDFSISGNVGKITKGENETITDQPIVITPTTPTVVEMGDKLKVSISSETNATATIEKIEKKSSGNVAVFSGKNFLNAYEIKITGENLTISVTMKYDDAGIDEDTIIPYRFDGTSWVAITPFTIDKTANTITFTISSGETVYGVFGSVVQAAPTGGTTGGETTTGDTTAPSISAVNTVVGDTTAIITWQTNEGSISWIVYGTTTAYGEEAKTTTYVTSHSVTLNDLSPATTYHYQIKSKDTSGNIGSYIDKTFVTLALGEKITGDINKDNKVDIFDFNLLMVNWGDSPTNSAADLDDNGKVDIFDFNLLMVNWTG